MQSYRLVPLSVLAVCGWLSLLGTAFDAKAQASLDDEPSLAYAASQAQQNTCPALFANPHAKAEELAHLPGVSETPLKPYAGNESFATALKGAFPLTQVLAADFDVDNDGKTDGVFLTGFQQRHLDQSAYSVAELKATLSAAAAPAKGDDFLKMLVPPPGSAAKGFDEVVPLNLFRDKRVPIYYFDRWKLKHFEPNAPGAARFLPTAPTAQIRLLKVGNMNLLWLIMGDKATQQYLLRYLSDRTYGDVTHRLVIFCQS